MMMAMLALVMFAGIASAADATAKAKKVAGEITAIAADASTVTVQPRAMKNAKAAEAVVVPVVAGTTVTINGEKKTVADLKTGEKVVVTYDADGKNAASIVVAPVGEHNRK